MTKHEKASFAVQSLLLIALSCAAAHAQGTAASSMDFALPERLRLLQGQYVDLVLEVRNASAVTNLKVMAGSVDITSKFAAAEKADLDCDNSSDLILRANLQSFETVGDMELSATATVGSASLTAKRVVSIREFKYNNLGRRNIILFIGDAMGTAYRDAARLVSRAIVDDKGKNSFREGQFENLLEMDKMPVSGFSMTYGTDSIVPDSANTGTSWAAGNKTFLNAVNVFADGTDCKWRPNSLTNTTTAPFIHDNPRVETLWQYLKRRHSYRTGIVSTAAVTDATPAAEGAYVGFRQSRLEIARQYFENPMLNGRPAFDVIFGGGADPFTAAGRTDKRDLIQEFRNLGYRYVTTATELKALQYGQPTLGFFKGSATPAPATNGIATASDVNMDVAYDKLKLQRPASEPTVNLGTFTDQPMLELMTEKAIEILSTSFAQSPFILMVEAASIDKQSHPNNAAGTIWDTIEMDKAVGVARAWAAKRQNKDTLIVVTADHDQSMHIIGVANVPDAEYFNRSKSNRVEFTTPVGAQNFTVYGDIFANARAGVPVINGSTGASNNGGVGYMPGTFANSGTGAGSTYSTYLGFPAYKLDPASGYPVNEGADLRRLAVGFRTGDHTGSSVPVTAEGPGAFLFTGYMDQGDIMFRMAAALGDTSDGDKLLELLLKNPAYKVQGK
jgi:alkaline phosphatase